MHKSLRSIGRVSVVFFSLFLVLSAAQLPDKPKQATASSDFMERLAELDRLADGVGSAQHAVGPAANAIPDFFPALSALASSSGIPQSFLHRFTGRFARTEASYRDGKIQGIEVDRFVRAFNGFMEQTSAPDYCRISPIEVAFKRRLIATYLPHMADIAPPAETPTIEAFFQDFSPLEQFKDGFMSPLEAEFVLLDAINTRVNTPPEFQFTPEQVESQYRSRLAQIAAAGGTNPVRHAQKAVLTAWVPQSGGLYKAMTGAADDLGYSKVVELISGRLDDMGLER